MASHRRRTVRFSRKTTAKVALLRGLVFSLVEHGRIKTTIDKAKETRRHAERAVTVAKRGDLNSRRLLLSRYPNNDTVKKLFDDIAVKFKDREGGYTRIIKIGPRPGDNAEMAFLEFVDYDFNKVKADTEAVVAKKVTAKKKETTKKAKAAATK